MSTQNIPYDVFSIGDCVLDTYVDIDQADLIYGKEKHRPLKLCLNYAEKIAIKYSCQDIGGNAANVASGLAKLGLRTGIVSQIGDDVNGAVVSYHLQKAGVDTTFLKQEKTRKTRYGIVLNYKAERTILSYYPERKYKFPRLPDTNWIYYTSHGLNNDAIHSGILSYLKKHPHTKLAMNPGSYMLKEGLTNVRKILQHVHLLFVNKEEAQKILQTKAKIPHLLKKFGNKGVEIVVITDGSQGAYLHYQKKSFFLEPLPIPPLAKTGAGDAFASGFLSATIMNKTPLQALCWGNSNAAGTIQKFGAQKGLLTRSGINEYLKKYPNFFPTALD